MISTSVLLLLIGVLSVYRFGALALDNVKASFTPPAQVTLNGYALPKDFFYGCGVTAYQVEGAFKEDGKGRSIWDTFVHQQGHVVDRSTGDVAMDFYHSYARDIPLFGDALGINNFDFTISWPRILPNGRGATANEKGVQYYEKVAKVAHMHRMSTTCTLYHWDLPQALQDGYRGWANKKIVDDFDNYARLTMTALGTACDRWVSMNEPRTFCFEGYGGDEGLGAPGIRHDKKTMYKCLHHALLAHAKAYKTFKALKTKGIVHGTFGLRIDGAIGKPLNASSEADKKAVLRNNDFEIGCLLAPLTKGHYPRSMRKALGRLLPTFSKAQAGMVKDAYDLIYLDAYTSVFAGAVAGGDGCPRTSEYWPSCVKQTSTDLHGRPIGEPTGSDWNFLVNDTIISTLAYMHNHWGAKKLAIGENGMVVRHSDEISFEQRINDDSRIRWYKSTLKNLELALQQDIPLVGFVAWSCLRNFEWGSGYKGDFGLVYAEPGANKKRTPKLSSEYLRQAFTAQPS